MQVFCIFTGMRNLEQHHVNLSRGTSWETFVIEQISSLYTLLIPGVQFYYWRTARGAEVDLRVDAGSHRIPFEINVKSLLN